MYPYDVPSHCVPTNSFLAWLSAETAICVPTPLAFISTVLGSLSIFCGLTVQGPQIYKNWKLSSASGLSIYFLTEWLAGDITNLAGSTMTGQATWQILYALYYLIGDFILLAQYIWYTWLRHGRPLRAINMRLYRSSPGNGDTSPELESALHNRHNSAAWDYAFVPSKSPVSTAVQDKLSPKSKEHSSLPMRTHVRRSSQSSLPLPSTKATLLLTVCLAIAQARANPSYAISQHHHRHSRDDDGDAYLLPISLGNIFSWACCFFYLGSRIPQIYKNFRRRSCEGLSLHLFIAAFFGNLFYSTSMLFNPLAWGDYEPWGAHGWAGDIGSDQKEWMLHVAPFFIGAVGVLALDGVVYMQFRIFGDGPDDMDILKSDDIPGRVLVVQEDDGQGHKRWTRVSGWLRGWKPSLSSAASVDCSGRQTPVPDGSRHGVGERSLLLPVSVATSSSDGASTSASGRSYGSALN